MKSRGWTVIIVVALVVAVCVVAESLFGKKSSVPLRPEVQMFSCVRTVMAYAALAENPDAGRVLLLGGAADGYRSLFEHAGLECSNEPDGEFDIVFASGERTKKLDHAARKVLKGDGLWAECIDARAMSLAEFKKTLQSVPFDCVHIWMPGEFDWLIVGRRADSRPRLEDMMELFSLEDAFEDLVASKCDAVPVLFASYAGTREDVMPAFDGQPMSALARPEYFVTKEALSTDWLDYDGVEPDIRDMVRHEIRSMQIVRRMLLVGVMQAERGEEDKSVEAWAKVALRSPGDTMLVERLDRLSVNAQAFLKLGKTAMAARCYDTMAQIIPNDPLPVYNYGLCMRQLGEHELAERAMKRADELGKALESKHIGSPVPRGDEARP